MSNALSLKDENSAVVLEKVLIQGDLSKLSPQERLFYYNKVCTSLGLNPFTRPFDYIVLNGKLTLYAKRDCTDQLRNIHSVSVKITSREQMGDLYVVTAQGTNKAGRYDESIGAVNISNLRGDALANAMMKAETKAKRRVTLSLAGLGWLDETEADTIPDAKIVNIDADTGEITDPPQPQKTPQTQPQAKPQQTQQTPKPTNNSGELASEAQRKKIFAMTKSLGIEPETVKRIMADRYGLSDSKALTKKQATDLIEYFSRLENGEETWPPAEMFNGQEQANMEFPE